MIKTLDLTYFNTLNEKVVVAIDSVLLSFDQIKCIYREIKSIEVRKK